MDKLVIPLDLEAGDRLWYSETQYATVGYGCCTYGKYPDRIAAVTQKGLVRVYNCATGQEIDDDTPPIIRVERTTSAPKAKAKRGKVDSDASFLLRMALKVSGPLRKQHVHTKHERARIRAIARRLNGGECHE